MTGYTLFQNSIVFNIFRLSRRTQIFFVKTWQWATSLAWLKFKIALFHNFFVCVHVYIYILQRLKPSNQHPDNFAVRTSFQDKIPLYKSYIHSCSSLINSYPCNAGAKLAVLQYGHRFKDLFGPSSHMILEKKLSLFCSYLAMFVIVIIGHIWLP